MIDNKQRDEVLTIFMEECAEATVEASKLIRFGSETYFKSFKMESEIGDLLCMIDLLEEYGIIDLEEVEKHKNAKREKLKIWSNLRKL